DPDGPVRRGGRAARRHEAAVRTGARRRRAGTRDVPSPRGARRPEGHVLARVSHDVRNPLAAVVGSASILQQRGEDLSKEQQTALIDAIVRSGRQITRLIEELLDVEKIRGRAFEPEAVVSQDLSSLVTGVVNEWAATRGR